MQRTIRHDNEKAEKPNPSFFAVILRKKGPKPILSNDFPLPMECMSEFLAVWIFLQKFR